MNNAIMNLGLLIEIPTSREEACARGLPGNVGKLVLYAIEKTSEEHAANVDRLAQWLWHWVVPGEFLYASPHVPFLSEKKMAAFLRSTGLESNSVRLDVQTYLIRCTSEEEVHSILDRCTSEALVFMIDTDGHSARETLIAVEAYANNYPGYEAPFMSRLDKHGGFFFFAETHQSLEVMGTEDFVRERCLRPLMEEFMPSTDT